MGVDKKKADKSPPLNFDEITGSLSIAFAQINQQQSDILSLATRVAELECRCSGLE